MLSPDDRTLLVDLLSPPDGFVLEHAIGTTFTLHLTALLPIPLGFAGADLNANADPLGVLQAVRTYADRVDVFCQAGLVAVPVQRNDLLTFLEPIVHQVTPPRGHLFHPKIWILRFANEAGDERLRLICGSRNLTHDRAWDAVLCLDGERTLRRRAVNHPIADLISSLPARVPNGMDDRRTSMIGATVEALRYTEWEPPEGVADVSDWLTFHVFGPGRRKLPDFSGTRRLIISPFLNDAGLELVWPDGPCSLISRADQMDALTDVGRSWFDDDANSAFVLDDSAALPDLDAEDAGARWSLTGLHAKTYIVERARRAHVFVGSANATDAAFKGNDEVLVELVMKRAAHGIDATLGTEESKPKGSNGLRDLLMPHAFGELPKPDTEAELRWRLERALIDLASIPLTAEVELRPHLLAEHQSTVSLVLESGAPVSTPPDGAALTIGLLTLDGPLHRPTFGAPIHHRWGLDGIEQVTPFVVMRLTAGSGSTAVEVSSVVIARLIGDPPERFDRVLAQRLSDPQEFLRFMLLLLQLAGSAGEFPVGGGLIASASTRAAGDSTDGLLEAIVMALATQPNAIDDVDRLVHQLSSTDEGMAVLPDGWAEMWSAVRLARERLRGNR